MLNRKTIFAMVILIIPMLLASCIDKNQMDRIEQNQKDILARMDKMEDAVEKLKVPAVAQPTRPTIDYNKVYTLPDGTSYIKGKKTAKVTITEFSDFQCPYCARLQPTLKEVLTAYPNDVKLVYKDFPLSFHQHAKNAAKASRAAGEQGKFWEMHDLIFENFSTLSDEKFKEFATKLKLDMNKFLADFNSTKYDALIQQDIDLGRSASVSGTPTLFINGKRMGQRSFNDFKSSIDAILKGKG